MRFLSQHDVIKKTGAGKWKGRYTILLLLWSGWFLSMLDRMVMNVSLPFIGEELGIDKLTQGTIVSAFFLGYALLQVPGGWLADKFGPRKIMAFTVIWWSIFTGVTGLISVLPLLLVVRFLFGVGEGAFPASSWKTISLYFPKKEQGRATAIQSSVNTIGPAMAVLGAASIIEWFGWRTVFLSLSVPGLLLGYLFYRFCHNDPKQNSLISPEEYQEIAGVYPALPQATTMSFSTILRMPLLWQLALIWFLFDIAFWGLTTWLPSYLMDSRQLSLGETGVWAAIPFLFGAIGTLSGGYIADKYRSSLGVIYGISTCISGAFLYVMLYVDSLGMAIFFQCIAFLFMFMSFALFWGLVMDCIPSPIMGRASSIVNFGGQVAGVIAPILIGLLIDDKTANYNPAFMLMILSLVASAVMTIWMIMRRKNREIMLS